MGNVAEWMAGLGSDNDRVRFENFQKLLPLARDDPHRIYPFWDQLAVMLEKPEVSNKYYAICLLARAVKVDRDERFDALLPQFYALLEHESPVVAPNVAGMSGLIVNAKPRLEPEITARLLAAEGSCRCRHRDLFMGYVISAFDEYFDHLRDPGAVMEFAARQLDSSSPKTRRAARAFLKKRGEGR